MSGNFDWTDESEARLAKMWLEGRSASQIADALGGDLTRNAVIGKINRLGLVGRATRPASQVQACAAPPRIAAAKPKAVAEIAPPDPEKLAEIERRRELAAYDRIAPPAAVPPSIAASAPTRERMVKEKVLRASNVTAFARKKQSGLLAVNAVRKVERLAASPGLPVARPAAPEPIDWSPRRLSFLELDANQCRRLIDDDVYCGLATPSGKPWCAHCHTRMVVPRTPPMPRERLRVSAQPLIGSTAFAIGAK